MKITSRVLTAVVFMVCGWISAQESGRDVPLEIQRANENKTRFPGGWPGVNCWENRSEYTVRARLDTSSGSLFGEEETVDSNKSPDTLKRVVVRLDQDPQ